MGKPTKTHESGSKPIPQKSGWSALATITTFDRGKSCGQKWRKESAVVPKRVTAFTPSSLLAESLIDQLCKLFEKDPLSQKKLYRMICEKLYEMKLIDKTYEVEEFQFMRSYYQRALFHLLTVSNSPSIDSKLETFLSQSPSHLSLPPPINSGIFDWSRYQNEFDEIEFIARGGFGRVFRVRNKVDGCEYAIKKICLRYHGDEQFLRSLREVRTLAKLDHCNIVAYKAAWFEPLSSVVAGEECSSISSSKASPDIEPSDEAPESSVSDFRRESQDEVEDDSGNIVFANGNEDISKEFLSMRPSYNLSNEVSHLGLDNDCDNAKKSRVPHSLTANEVKSLSYPEHCGIICDHSSSSSNKYCRGKKVPGTGCGVECVVLHIQMQLCKESLRRWLDARNEAVQQLVGGGCHGTMGAVCVVTALRIFEGILNGVEYVHRMGVVHHDLKPSNIFVDGFETSPRSMGVEEGGERHGARMQQQEQGRGRQVRVGDFGLACFLTQPLTSLVTDLPAPGDGAVAHRVPTGRCLVQAASPSSDTREVVGTRLYAAPEQLEGHCSSMSDTYSLAIILFELLHPFFTAMERGKVISALRSSGKVPDVFEDAHPLLASLIKDMLSQNPSDRPPIEKILGVLQSILPGCDTVKVRSDSICSDDDASVRECVVRSGSSSFTQTRSEHWESCRVFSQSWEDVSLEESWAGGKYCGSWSCHAVRERQDEMISKLRQENLKKDEIIAELKGRILQLESSHQSNKDACRI